MAKGTTLQARYEPRFLSLGLRDRKSIAKRYRGFYTRMAEDLSRTPTAVRNVYFGILGSEAIAKHIDATLERLGELPHASNVNGGSK